MTESPSLRVRYTISRQAEQAMSMDEKVTNRKKKAPSPFLVRKRIDDVRTKMSLSKLVIDHFPTAVSRRDIDQRGAVVQIALHMVLDAPALGSARVLQLRR